MRVRWKLADGFAFLQSNSEFLFEKIFRTGPVDLVSGVSSLLDAGAPLSLLGLISRAPTDSLRTSPRTICDLGFDLILTKLSSGLTPDTAGKFELTGVEYRLRDFVVRVGTASQVTTTKGVIVEVNEFTRKPILTGPAIADFCCDVGFGSAIVTNQLPRVVT
ncbi:hypothetical protein Y032_0074g882 [Ancylostoma ceylanicum]|nr:hypothetical protein Y032_0074g882 [Ancylostoma ceylanicum]